MNSDNEDGPFPARSWPVPTLQLPPGLTSNALPQLPGLASPVTPLAPPIWASPGTYQRDLEKLRQLRSPLSKQRGERLADAAVRMRGWFQWMMSGPGDDHTINVVDDSNPNHVMVNNFAAWLVDDAPFPGPHARMNCWEAVLCSAVAAQLIDKTFLRVIHGRAAMHYERTGDSARYLAAIKELVKYREVVPFMPNVKLIPQKGDLLIDEDLAHLEISLGRRWTANGPQDMVIGLSDNFGMTFSIHDAALLRGRIGFRPCPF